MRACGISLSTSLPPGRACEGSGRTGYRAGEKMISRSPDVCKAQSRTPGIQQRLRGGHPVARVRPRHVFGSLPNWQGRPERITIIQTFAADLPQERSIAVPCRAGQGTGSRLGRIQSRGMPAHIPAHGLKVHCATGGTLLDDPNFAHPRDGLPNPGLRRTVFQARNGIQYNVINTDQDHNVIIHDSFIIKTSI